MMFADPDRACDHPDFAAFVTVNRITDPNDEAVVLGFSADIRVDCAACGERMRWIGVPGGLSPTFPTASVDETELRAPLRPAGADPDYGLGLPGFGIR